MLSTWQRCLLLLYPDKKSPLHSSSFFFGKSLRKKGICKFFPFLFGDGAFASSPFTCAQLVHGKKNPIFPSFSFSSLDGENASTEMLGGGETISANPRQRKRSRRGRISNIQPLSSFCFLRVCETDLLSPPPQRARERANKKIGTPPSRNNSRAPQPGYLGHFSPGWL